jgi:hypothetical protein
MLSYSRDYGIGVLVDSTSLGNGAYLIQTDSIGTDQENDLTVLYAQTADGAAGRRTAWCTLIGDTSAYQAGSTHQLLQAQHLRKADIQGLNPLQRAEGCQLRDELLIRYRFQRILILQLRNEQLQELLLRDCIDG